MVVHDFQFGWAGTSIRPLEADPPLIVDPDAPLPLAPALEGLQAIAGSRRIAQACGRVELVELARGGAGEAREGRDPATPMECVGPSVPEADDQGLVRFRGKRTMRTRMCTSASRQALRIPSRWLASLRRQAQATAFGPAYLSENRPQRRRNLGVHESARSSSSSSSSICSLMSRAVSTVSVLP